jgi:hypothetical protein
MREGVDRDHGPPPGVGGIQCSCGHWLVGDEDSVPVTYGGETCDAVDGFSRCITYAEFCPACAVEWQEEGLLFNSEAEADAYLDGADIAA